MRISRRQFVVGSASLAVGAVGLGAWNWWKGSQAKADPLLVNDIHSRLNQTHVAGVAKPGSLEDLIGIVHRAKREGTSLSICGSRHSMGGQQFAEG